MVQNLTEVNIGSGNGLLQSGMLTHMASLGHHDWITVAETDQMTDV